jgi:hypothetical protein
LVLLSWGDELVIGKFVFDDELVLSSWGDESAGVFVVGNKLVLSSWGDELALRAKHSFTSWQNCSASSQRGRGDLLPRFHWDAAVWSLLEVFAEQIPM